MCLKGTLFTPLSEHNTSTQSLNVQLRKVLDLHVNLVHGWTMPGVPTRFSDVDIVVIRSAAAPGVGLLPFIPLGYDPLTIDLSTSLLGDHHIKDKARLHLWIQ